MKEKNNNSGNRQVHLEEYRTLRAEILLRLENQYKVTQLGLALFSAFLALVGFIVSEGLVNMEHPRLFIRILFTAPIPFGLILWAYQEQNFFISAIGDYLNNVLAPKIGIGWENYFAQRRTIHHDLVTGSRFLFLCLFAISPMAVAAYIAYQNGLIFTLPEWSLIGVDGVILIGAFWSRLATVKSFKAIVRQSNKSRKKSNGKIKIEKKTADDIKS